MIDRGGLLIATFSDPDDLLAAVRPLRHEGFAIHDVFAPYPIAGLDQAMALRRTRLPLLALLAGVAGLTFALLIQFYANVLDWPLDVGGKPDNSTLAFVPVSFDLTVLMAALTTVGALLLRSRLYPGKRAVLPAPRVTDDRFALVLHAPFDLAGRQRALRLLAAHGAESVDESETGP